MAGIKAYHFHFGHISRGEGGTAVGFAAYCARERLEDERTGEVFNHSRKRADVLYSRLLTPASAPSWATDRAELWNRAEAAEKRKDSRTAATIDAALPNQLPQTAQEDLIENFAQHLTRQGLIVDVNMHRGDANENLHVHMMVTTRQLDGDKFAAGKYLALDQKKTLLGLRETWAAECAEQLERLGLSEEAKRWQFSHLTLEKQLERSDERDDLAFSAALRQRIAQGAGRHIGRAALELEKRGKHSHRLEQIRAEQQEVKEQIQTQTTDREELAPARQAQEAMTALRTIVRVWRSAAQVLIRQRDAGHAWRDLARQIGRRQPRPVPPQVEEGQTDPPKHWPARDGFTSWLESVMLRV